MRESVVHLTIEVVHKLVCLGASLTLKVLQESARHVSALRQHIIKVAQAFLS